MTGGRGRFVLLEHRRDGVHWDLMFEAGPVLWTWAIDEPVVAGGDLSARRLADHRPAYLDYEGPISGGRGTVRRVAEGTYRLLERADDRFRAELIGDQVTGIVELVRAGESVRGAEDEPWTFRLMGKVDCNKSRPGNEI